MKDLVTRLDYTKHSELRYGDEVMECAESRIHKRWTKCEYQLKNCE